jgi:hypothetical protein
LASKDDAAAQGRSKGDGKFCDHFTIIDAYSRYLIRCQIGSRMDLNRVLANL